MTLILAITNPDESVVVDLTNLNPRINRDGTNPLIIITLPADVSEGMQGGAEAFDLKMMQDQISISFVLKDGPEKGVPVYGHHRFDPAVAGVENMTNYEKLYYLFKYESNYKHLYWGDTAEETTKFHVVITRLSVSLEPGHKDFMADCQIVMQIVNKDDS